MVSDGDCAGHLFGGGAALNMLTVIVWGIVTGEQPRVQRILAGHSDAITCVAWSRNDRWLVSCAKEKIKLWNPDTGEELREFSHADTDTVASLAWLVPPLLLHTADYKGIS
ncbi:hypothetical protein T484DRAFT_1776956 [Baffinella frigidus]|nr:hypothetical protein T484DRAFT_1776956 [Cryptophyta sp. CCMP2293]